MAEEGKQDRLPDEAREILGDRAPSARFAVAEDLASAAVFAIVHGNGCSALLLPRNDELVNRAVHEAWPAALGCPVVVVP